MIRASSLVSPLKPFEPAAVFGLGRRWAKEAADASNPPQTSYDLSGRLYLSSTGWLLLAVPNGLVRGVYSALDAPGIELPPTPEGQLNAHISVMRASEIAEIGGADKITERGKMFSYTLGRLYTMEPEGWPEMAKVWFLRVHSPELQALRRSYGLSSLPNDGKYDFHCTVAVQRRGVLGRNDKSKATEEK